MLFLNLSAAAHSFCSNPRFAPLLVLAIETPSIIINFYLNLICLY
jgi:hypothetical protein